MSEEKRTYKELGESLKIHLDEERTKWSASIKELFIKLNDNPEKMFDIQALGLSFRHILSDEIAIYTTKYSAELRKLKTKRKNKYIYYSTGMLPDGRKLTPQEIAKHSPIVGLKTSKQEKDLVISGDLCDEEFVLELFDIHIGFLKDTIKTTDNCIYGIKNMLDYFNLMKK